MNQLEQVRAKVIAAVPEIEKDHRKKIWFYENEHQDSYTFYWKKYKKARPIRLSDVLVAMSGNYNTPEMLIGNGLAFVKEMGYEGAFEWNLRADSLDEQSPETIEFLAKILVV